MDREKLIDGIIETYPPARDAEQARAGLNRLNDDQISDLHGRITATHKRAVNLQAHRKSLTEAKRAGFEGAEEEVIPSGGDQHFNMT